MTDEQLESRTPGTLSADTRAAMEYDAEKKSVLVAYLLWFFLGGIGAHRFYLGRTKSAIWMIVLLVASLVLTFVAIGGLGLAALGIWIIVDAFLIPGMSRDYNQALIERIDSGSVGLPVS